MFLNPVFAQPAILPQLIDGSVSVPRILLLNYFPPKTIKRNLKKYEVYEKSSVLEYRIRHPKETTILKYVVDVKVILTFTIFDSGR